MKMNKLEIGFLGMNAILAGSGTAAGFTFTTLGALTALLNLTGVILASVSIAGIVVFGILMLAVAGYFFYKNFHTSQVLAEKLERTKTTLTALEEKRRDAAINEPNKTDSPNRFFADSPKLLACVNLPINFGCLLGPCLGLIGAISGVGIIAGISAIAPPVLIGIVVTVIVLAMIASYGVYYCENRNAERQNQITAMEEQIKRLSNIDENLSITDSYSIGGFPEPLFKPIPMTGTNERASKFCCIL